MAAPTFASLKKYVGTALKNTDWDFNFQNIVGWLTAGTYDLTVGSLTTSGTVTAGTFTGNGSGLTNVGGGNPVGTSIATYVATTPVGYLYEDGAEYSRTTYADLFAAISTTFGKGNGTSTFNVPDTRGLFLRGVNGVMTQDFTVSTTTFTTGTNHVYNRNGFPLQAYSSGGTLPSAMSLNLTYYARILSPTTIELYDSFSNACNTVSTTGRVSCAADGSGTFRFLSWCSPNESLRKNLYDGNGGALGWQEDAFKTHDTGNESAAHAHTYPWDIDKSGTGHDVGKFVNGDAGAEIITTSTESATHVHTATGSSENRPVNMTVYRYIKY